MGTAISLAPFNYQDDWRLNLVSIPMGFAVGYMMAGDIIDVVGIQDDLWVGIFGLTVIALAIVVARDLLYIMAGERREEDE